MPPRNQPLLNRVATTLSNLDESNASADTASHIRGTVGGFHIAALIITVFDFIRIPLIYLMAYLSNKPLPVNLSNNVKWLYATFLLGLIVTAVLLPITAPVITFVFAASMMIASIFTLKETLSKHFALKNELKVVQQTITELEEGMNNIRLQAKSLEAELNNAQLGDFTDMDKLDEIVARSNQLYEHDYLLQHEALYKAKAQEATLKEELAQSDILRIVDRCMGITLATAAVIGLVIALFFPPIGLTALFAISVTSLVYTLGRIIPPVVMGIGKWLLNLFKSDSQIEDHGQNAENAVQHTQDDSLSVSTSNMISRFKNNVPSENTEEASIEENFKGLLLSESSLSFAVDSPEDTLNTDLAYRRIF